MNRDILAKVFDHAKVVDEWCAKNGGVRVMTALFGSQNYGLATENSDVDTKSIIIPDLNDWTWGDIDKYNTTIVLDDGSHAEIKPLVDMCKQYIKGNINFLETLYTEYIDIAPAWEWVYDEFLAVREKFVTMNPYRQGKTLLGYMRQALQRAFNSTSVSLGYQEKYKYNPKSLMNAFRIKETIIRLFIFHRDFKSSIDVSDMRGILLDVKNSPMPYEVAFIYGSDMTQWIDDMNDYIQLNYKDQNTFNCEFYCKNLCKLVYYELSRSEVIEE